MTAWTYDSFARDLLTGAITLGRDVFSVMLLGPTYRPDRRQHRTLADLWGEVAGDGYRAGGRRVLGLSVTDDGVVRADDVVWARASITARYAVLYRVGDSNPLVACYDLRKNGEDMESYDDEFRLIWDEGGILSGATIPSS